jgi:hypothetical protein
MSDFTVTDRNNLTALIGRMEKAETAIWELQKDRRPPVVEAVSDPIGGITYDEAIRQRDEARDDLRDAKLDLVAARNIIDRMANFVDWKGTGRLMRDAHKFMGWDQP